MARVSWCIPAAWTRCSSPAWRRKSWRRALAVIADSPSLPRRELQEALAIAEQFRFPVRVVRTAEFENPEYLSNPANRCYFCKHELFEQLRRSRARKNLR